mmetsp:Transcript_24782/g.69587  ORF Transcript_24782/g.69587 Transcript_24782/m.69587 type:complete len:140 (-) Transcript_24782:62-481(-)
MISSMDSVMININMNNDNSNNNNDNDSQSGHDSMRSSSMSSHSSSSTNTNTTRRRSVLRTSSFNKTIDGIHEFGWKRCQRRKETPRNIQINESYNSIQNIPRFVNSQYNELYYDDDDIAQFRNDAFMEKCGLDPTLMWG